MAPFRLLSLPFLAFEQVIKILELIEVFEFSQVSRKAYTLIKLVKLNIHPIKIIKGEVDQVVEVTRKYNETSKLTFLFEALTQPLIRCIRLYRCQLYIRKEILEKSTFICYSHQFDSQFHHLVNYLSDLFHNDTNAFWVRHTRIKEIEDVIRNPIFENCVSLKVTADPYDEVRMKSEDLKLLLETKPRLEALMLNCWVEEPEKFRHVLDIPRVYIRYAEWISIDDLINCKSETILLKFHSLKEIDISKYVHHWITTKTSNIRSLELGNFKNRPNLKNVLKDIEYTRKFGTREPRDHRTKGTYSPIVVNCQFGWDFVKEDGTLATVVSNSNYFNFVVWYRQ